MPKPSIMNSEKLIHTSGCGGPQLSSESADLSIYPLLLNVVDLFPHVLLLYSIFLRYDGIIVPVSVVSGFFRESEFRYVTLATDGGPRWKVCVCVAYLTPCSLSRGLEVSG